MIDHGHGVQLGPIDPEHLPRLRAWRNDPRIWKWCRQNDLISEGAQEAWYVRMLSDPTIRMYLVLRDGVVVGVTGLTSIDQTNQRAEFSLYIGPEQQGGGLGGAALETLLAHGFKALNLNCIWGETFDKNPAVHVFDRLGFVKEGTRRSFYFREGRFIDCHLYSLLRSEWESRLAGRAVVGEPAKSVVGGSSIAAELARLQARALRDEKTGG
jgi:RimJ/RimL family protein N-acetyltransferase